MRLERDEAEAVLYLSNTSPTYWQVLMSYVERELKHAHKEIEEATDMVFVAREQGKIAVLREMASLAARAESARNQRN